MSIQNVITNTSAIAGQWQHVVGVYDGSTYSVYIDGVLDSATPRTDSVTASQGPDTKIGAFDLGRYPYNGLVDEVQFFNRALSASEIQAIFAAGSANGGTGGNRDCNYAGGGSGGAIRLVSNTITGSGSTSVVGGLGSNSNPNNAGVAGGFVSRLFLSDVIVSAATIPNQTLCPCSCPRLLRLLYWLQV